MNDDRLTLAGLFFETAAGLASRLDPALDEAGLSRQWFEVMLRLARTPGHRLRMSDLASQVTLTASGLTRVVDRLEAGGFVVRLACPEDRRGAYAELTPAGLARLESVLPTHVAQIDEHLIGLLSSRDRQQLERILRRVRDHVHPGGATGTC